MATFKGVITHASAESKGTSKSGKEWRRRDYIIEYDCTNKDYPKSVSFSVFNDEIDKKGIVLGKIYEVDLDFTAREFNGKYYLSASCWKATEIEPQAVSGPPIYPNDQYAELGVKPRERQTAPQEIEGDALPF